MQFRFTRVDWEFVSAFRIAYRTRTHAQTVLVEVRDGNLTGRGAASGVTYYGESIETILDQLTHVVGELRNGISRVQLQSIMPAGGARNAVDCALWDLEAKRLGLRAWQLAGLKSVASS